MSDLIADLRQKLARFDLACEEGVTDYEFGRHWGVLSNAAGKALPGLLDELEAARALIDVIDDGRLDDMISWESDDDLVGAYRSARAANG